MSEQGEGLPSFDQTTGQISNTETVPAAEVQATPATPPEAPATEAKKEEPVIDRDAYFSKFNELTKRERAFWKKEQELKNQYADYDQLKAKIREYEEGLTKDPLKFLEKHNWDYKKLTDYVINDRKMTPEHQVEEVRKQLAALQEERQREIEYQQELAKHNAVNTFKNEIKFSVADNSLYRALGDEFIDSVYNVIDSHYQETEEIMKLSDAVSKVEGYYQQRLDPLLKVDKFKELALKVLGVNQANETKKPNDVSPTLTNVYANAAPKGQTGSDYLSEDESKARMIAMLHEQLNKKRT